MSKIIPFPEDLPPGPNTLPQRDIDLLQNLGIHIDYINPLTHGKPFGADIITVKPKNKPMSNETE